MAATTFGWLVLLCPLLGTVVIGAGFRRLPGRSAGWIATGAIALSFAFSVAALISLLGRDTARAPADLDLWNYANTIGVDAKLRSSSIRCRCS